MRRAFIVGLAALAAALVVGCGGLSESNRQADAIAKTYSTYIEAVKQGDGKAACPLLTPAFQRRAGSAVAVGSRAKLKGAACPKAISQGTLPQIQQVVPNLERIEVNGDRASGLDPGEGQIGPQKVLFKRLGGDWKISKTIFFG